MRTLFSLLALGLLPLFTGVALADKTFSPQVWLTASVSQRYDYGLEFMLETEQRLSSEASLYHRYEITPQVIWHYSPRYDFSLGYEENREWNAGTHDLGAHEAFGSVTIRLPLKAWLITTRERWQGGADDRGTSSLVFRQQTRVSYEKLRLRPYVQNEWFWDSLHGGGLMENRAQAGISYRWNRAWQTELYAMRLDQWMADGVHLLTPVVGLNLNLTF
jgi:hypothetical protein